MTSAPMEVGVIKTYTKHANTQIDWMCGLNGVNKGFSLDSYQKISQIGELENAYVWVGMFRQEQQ